MKYTLYIFTLIILGTHFANAGSLDIETKNTDTDYKVGDEILFEVNLDTQNEFYNAVSGTLTFDNTFEIKQIITGGSAISAWVENPANAKSNSIDFAGIIAGGFNGSEKVFQVIAIPAKSGPVNISLINSSIFLNDGSGTEFQIPDKFLTTQIRNTSPGEENVRITLKDNISPQVFDVTITSDPNIADGKYVLIFEAIDKGTGIRTYEVLEGRKVFTQAKSPYVLVNQKLNERIYVKAIDYDGNETAVRVEVPGKVCVGTKCFDQKFTILILIVVFIFSFILWRKQSKELKRISETIS